MITGESSTPAASAPLTHITKDLEIDKAIAHETEAPLRHKSLLETTATENLFASNEMAADAFTLDAAPTQSGRQRQMQDMAKVHACICGSVISKEEIKESTAVIECAHRGCEARYFRLHCIDLEYAPKNWHCDNHKSYKWARR